MTSNVENPPNHRFWIEHGLDITRVSRDEYVHICIYIYVPNLMHLYINQDLIFL